MREKPPVVMLSGIRWDFLWQRHQILATRFARAGYSTIFVETTGLSTPRPTMSTLREVSARVMRPGEKREEPKMRADNLTVYSPLVAPPTARPFRSINRRVLVPRVVRDLRAMLGEKRPIVVAYPPTQTSLDLLAGLEPRLLHYDCSENYAGFPGIPNDVGHTEEELLRRADVVTCTSRFLLEKVRPIRPDAFVCGPGVDHERFALLRSDSPVAEVRTVCFFGHVSEERVDFSVVRDIARAGYTVRLVGSLGRVDEGLLQEPGVDYRGAVSHADLPAALEGSDAFIIPYRINTLTRGISPAKIYECLATGRPVVASPLPELRRLSEHVYLAEGAAGFVDALRRLPVSESEEKARARVELARDNSWEARFRTIEEALWKEM